MCGLDTQPPLLLTTPASWHVAVARRMDGSVRLLPLLHGNHALEPLGEGCTTPPRVACGLDDTAVANRYDRSVKPYLHLDLRASHALTEAPRIELEQLPAESDRVILRYDARIPQAENPRKIQLSWNRAVGYSRDTWFHSEASVVPWEVLRQNPIGVGEVLCPSQAQLHSQTIL